MEFPAGPAASETSEKTATLFFSLLFFRRR
jgi:hypothetical protein